MDLKRGSLLPMPRPIPLKNDSISIFRARMTGLEMGPVYAKTRKGDVSHVLPPDASLRDQNEPGTPALLVFPRYTAGAPLRLQRQPPHLVHTRLANNAFNYQISGRPAFDFLTRLAVSVPAYELTFSDTDAAILALEELLEGPDA